LRWQKAKEEMVEDAERSEPHTQEKREAKAWERKAGSLRGVFLCTVALFTRYLVTGTTACNSIYIYSQALG